MKLIITEAEHEEGSSIEYRLRRVGKSDIVADFNDGEPEDNCLGRNFNDVYNIEELIKSAYEAGKAGEDFEIENINTDTW